MSQAAEPPADDPLRAFLSGKRRAPRHPSALKVVLHGNGQTVAGRTVDLSAGGALVRVPDGELGGSAPVPSLIDLLSLVEKHFQSGVEIEFPSRSLRMPTVLVRMTTPPGETGYVLLGCRFVKSLSEAERAHLLPEEASIPKSPLSFVPKAGATVQALVFLERPDLAGPIVGAVAAIEGARFDVRFESSAAPTAGAAEDLLGDRTARVRVIETGAVLWEGAAKIVCAAPAPSGDTRAPACGVDVRFDAGTPLSPALSKRFRERR